MIGTPLYMSPEQAGVSSEDIDTRSDVYSLGVVLYQLICGRLPFGPEVLREKGYLEMQRVIREEDPPRPSTQITIQAKQSSEETTRIAFERQTSVQELAKTLKRELEWIPLKALRKDRTERYSTAEALADDVRRYLTGDALEAGPESTTYRLRKLLRRHRGPVVAASLVTLALIGGIIGTTTFAVEASSARAEAERQAGLAEANRELAEQKTVEVEAAAVALAEERDLAQTARARAEASMDFLASIFKGLDPDTARTQDTTLLNQILQDAAERVGTELADSPLVEAEVLSSIASAHEAIFEFRAALVELERLHALRLEHLGIEDPETLSDLLDMGRVHDKLGETEIAVQLWGEAVEGLLKTQTADFILTRLATNYYAGGLTRLGRVEEGIALRRRELAGLVEALGTATPQVTDARANLAHGLMMVGQHAEAAQLYEECLEFMNIAPGLTDPSTLSARQNWINCIGHLGREEEALTEYRSLLKDLTSVFPDDHPKIALCHFYIGSALLDLGRPTEAVEAISLSLDLHAAIYGIHHAGTLASARIQLAAMSDLEDWEAAAAFGETWFQHHMEAPMYGPSDARTAALAGRLGDIFRFWNELAPDPTRASKSKEYATIHEDWRAAQEEGEEG
jgi:non-specific serine/threonine protein kinase/serine/threonine-protein kinase